MKDLANDPDIDLVVCSVRVDRHFLTVRPSLEAGKAVFVEWPLDRNLEVAKEMASLAAAHNAKTIVGLQASYSPIIRKLRQLVHEGAIGRILSSTLLGSCGNELTSESKNVRYFLDRMVGGNLMSIAVGHNLESVISGMSPYIGNMQHADHEQSLGNSKALPAAVPLVVRNWTLSITRTGAR
jgi:predicted dehydrogenase